MAGELGFEPRHLAISPVFKTGPLAVRTSTHNLKIYIVITSKKIPHLIWFLKKMVRPRGVEPLLPGWKPGVLTTRRRPHKTQMVDPAGLEPATARLWAECSNQLSYGSLMAYLKRFELLAHGLEGRCSIQLSYRYTSLFFSLLKWWAILGSNQWHLD